MRIAPILTRDCLLQPLLHLERRLADCKPQTVRHAKDMGVDGNRGCVKGDAHHDICRLASDARETLQGLKVCRNLAAILLQEDVTGLQNVFRLHAEESAVVNRCLELFLPKRGNCLRCIRTRKESARHNIHAHIRTLR